MPHHKPRRHPKPLRKTGLPPGSLIATAAPKTAEPRISAMLYDAASLEERTLHDLTGLADWRSGGERHLWLNVYGIHRPELLQAVGERFGLHPLVLEDIMNPSQRPKLEDYGDYLYFVVRLFDGEAAGDGLASDQVSLVLGRNFVLSFQERPSGSFASVRERLRGPRSVARSQGCGYLAYCLLDSLVDRYFETVDRLGDQAELLEEEALGGARHDLLERINRVKHDTRQVRRAVWPLREVLNSLLRDDSDFFDDNTQLYLRDVYDHTVHVIETLDSVRELLGDLMDIYLSSVSHRLNLELRVLTVLSTLFMPATLIAGIFGMNFHSMPLLDRSEGFWDALYLMGGIALVMVAIFWRRNWLKS